MTRAAFILVLAVLAVGPVPIAIHEAIDPDHHHSAGAAICPSDEHHDRCHVCATLSGRTLDVAAAALASAPADFDGALVFDTALPTTPVVDLPRSRGPPVTLS